MYFFVFFGYSLLFAHSRKIHAHEHFGWPFTNNRRARKMHVLQYMYMEEEECIMVIWDNVTVCLHSTASYEPQLGSEMAGRYGLGVDLQQQNTIVLTYSWQMNRRFWAESLSSSHTPRKRVTDEYPRDTE